MATISPMSRRRRQSLTIQQEQQIYAQKQASPKMTQKALAGWAKAAFALQYEPTLPTISAILKRMREREQEALIRVRAQEQAEEWERVLKWRRRCRLKEKRCIKLMKLEYEMNRWLLQCARNEAPISSAQIEQRVEALCEQLKITDHMRPYHWGMYLAQFTKSNALCQYKYSPEDFADDRMFEFEMKTSDGYSPESDEDGSDVSDAEADPGNEWSELLTNSEPESYGGSEPLFFRHLENDEGLEPSEGEERGNDSDTEDSDGLQEEEVDVKWGWYESAGVLCDTPVKSEPCLPAFATSMKSDSGALSSSTIKQEPQLSIMRPTPFSTIPNSIKMEQTRFDTMSAFVKMESPLFAVPSFVEMTEPGFSIKNETNNEISRRVDLENYHWQSNCFSTPTEYPAKRKRETDSFVEGFRNNTFDDLKRAKVPDDSNSLLHEYLEDSEEEDDDDGVNALMRKHI